jgi:hypothetical protein
VRIGGATLLRFYCDLLKQVETTRSDCECGPFLRERERNCLTDA